MSTSTLVTSARGDVPPAAELDSAADRWRQVMYATGPADRDEAAAGVRQAYHAAGLPEPERILWLDSPLLGALTAAVATDPDAMPILRDAGLDGPAREALARIGLGGTGAPVREAVRTRPWELARAGAHARLGPSGFTRAWDRTGARLWDLSNRLVRDLRRAVGEAAAGHDDAAALLRAATLDAVLGQHDAPWLAMFDALGRGETLGLAWVARSAGWWWPFERVAILCERPAELHLDESGRPHGASGPAIAFPDGFALHAWRGMPVPEGFAATLATITPQRIRAEENAELRRVMLEHYGIERYLADTGARPVQRDAAGVLWRIDMPGDEPVVMVEVVNSTPEPDGTRRTYWLRVPPYVTTAREGVAWTFGLSADDYRPKVET